MVLLDLLQCNRLNTPGTEKFRTDDASISWKKKCSYSPTTGVLENISKTPKLIGGLQAFSPF